MDRRRRNQLAEELATRIRQTRDDVVAIVLYGSVARGDDLPASDVDMAVFTRESSPRGQAFVLDDVSFSVWWMPWRAFRKDLLTPRADCVRFAFFDGDVLHDPSGRVARLRKQIRALPKTYYTEAAREELHNMHEYVSKAKNLRRRKDATNLAYVAHTIALQGASVVALLNRRYYTSEMAMNREWQAMPDLPNRFGFHFRHCRDPESSPHERYQSILALWTVVRAWAASRGATLRTARTLRDVRLPKSR